jgi:hypothetical protein
MSTPITPNLNGLPSAADLDAHVADHLQKEQNAIDGQHDLAPHPASDRAGASRSRSTDVCTWPERPIPCRIETSHGHGIPGGPTHPSIDTTKFDDVGNVKDLGEHGEGFGPRGENKPRDVMTDAERQAHVDAAEKVLQAGLAPTNAIDSVGKAKGSFAVTPQGPRRSRDALAGQNRLPRKPIEPVAAHVGPRGVGAPPDTFHGERPEKSHDGACQGSCAIGRDCSM